MTPLQIRMADYLDKLLDSNIIYTGAIEDNQWFLDSGHHSYAYLPDNFRLFFEHSETYPLDKQKEATDEK